MAGNRPRKKSSVARQRHISERLSREASVSIAALAVELGVSEMTVRRDLEALEKTSSIQRTHGGAVLSERMIFEFEYRDRQKERLEQKREIAEAALRLIKPGERILLDTGTTTLHLARILPRVGELTVLTPSLAVVSELQFAENLELILLGGAVRKGSPDLTGPVTEHCLELFAADWVFQGAESIGLDGSVYNVDLQLGQVDRKMRSRAGRSCLLADSSKIGGCAQVRTGSLADFDWFITDSGASEMFLETARRLTPEVVIV